MKPAAVPINQPMTVPLQPPNRRTVKEAIAPRIPLDLIAWIILFDIAGRRKKEEGRRKKEEKIQILLDRVMILETGDRASYSLESFEFDYCTKSDET